jgi:hypothetical protein
VVQVRVAAGRLGQRQSWVFKERVSRGSAS